MFGSKKKPWLDQEREREITRTNKARGVDVFTRTDLEEFRSLADSISTAARTYGCSAEEFTENYTRLITSN